MQKFLLEFGNSGNRGADHFRTVGTLRSLLRLRPPNQLPGSCARVLLEILGTATWLLCHGAFGDPQNPAWL